MMVETKCSKKIAKNMTISDKEHKNWKTKKKAKNREIFLLKAKSKILQSS
jgi:hypothetical protein